MRKKLLLTIFLLVTFLNGANETLETILTIVKQGNFQSLHTVRTLMLVIGHNFAQNTDSLEVCLKITEQEKKESHSYISTEINKFKSDLDTLENEGKLILKFEDKPGLYGLHKPVKTYERIYVPS